MHSTEIAIIVRLILRYIKSKATADTRHEAVSPEMRELLRDYQEESDSNRRFSERIRNGIQ